MNLTNGSDIASGGAAHDPYAALRIRNFQLFLGGSLIANTGLAMQATAIGWEVSGRAETVPAAARLLSFVGLVQVVPVVLLTLVAGHVADRFSRKWIVIASMIVACVASLGLVAVSRAHGPLVLLYGCLLLSAIGRAFHQPAKSSLLPQIVPRDKFSSAVAWGMSGFQLSSVLGPALGGLLIRWFAPATVYLLAAAGTIVYVLLMSLVRNVAPVRASAEVTLNTSVAGFAFVWRHPVVLAAITLDLFAVLLGGATALLPIYAKDILKVGAVGYGWLEAAPAIGAMLMAITMAHRPPLGHAGRTLLWAVAGFGAATIVFGLSGNFWLSFGMFFLTGALDNISVVVRQTLVQMQTPDAMRGRVSAVNGMFIGASNELGGFESGQIAYLFGPTVSVVAGGIGTLLVVGLVAALCPQLRRYGRLDSIAEEAGGESGPDVAPRAADRPGVTPLAPLLPAAGEAEAESTP